MFDKILVIAFAPHAYPSLAHSVITSSLNLATRYTSSIDLLMVAFVSFVIYAASIFFSYGFARRNAYETRRVVGNSLVFAFLISVIATALMFAIIPSILRLQIRNNSSSSFVYKLSYHFIIIFVMGLPLRTFGYLLLTFISREGHTFVSLVLLIASLLFNILLNYLLLSQTSLGIIASSLATVSI